MVGTAEVRYGPIAAPQMTHGARFGSEQPQSAPSLSASRGCQKCPDHQHSPRSSSLYSEVAGACTQPRILLHLRTHLSLTLQTYPWIPDGQAVAPSIWCTQQKAWWAAAFWAASRLVATWPSLIVVGRSSQADNRCAQAEACQLVLRAIYQDAPHLGELGAPRIASAWHRRPGLDCSRLLSLLDQAWGPYEEDGGGGDHSPALGDNAGETVRQVLAVTSASFCGHLYQTTSLWRWLRGLS